ncbi:hypothetical protein [Streptomyces alanosinicus]|uniref:Uncharacterized protein n=1 Tax=Streptomyces alanosinicus TaxID=68171 RepID=A0A918YE29_9ACTN|nr:hypothetical protein [Streptomyces alanosinicus]GHE00561.1 hypothetical protein GCM10010339_16220 [Streptomyces alanosinicus]
MPEHAPTLQLIGVAVLAVATVVWAVVLMRLLRRTGLQTPARRTAAALPALPRQRRVGPALESVELTPAEQDAFAGLARQFANG